LPTAAPKLGSPHLWLLDRFTQPYLNEWATFSLKAEWRYVHAETLPPCDRKEMKHRRVDPDELSRAIAHRIAAEEDSGMDRKLDDVSHVAKLKIDASLYVPVALKLLESGDREAASALFDAAVALNASDAQQSWVLPLARSP